MLRPVLNAALLWFVAAPAMYVQIVVQQAGARNRKIFTQREL